MKSGYTHVTMLIDRSGSMVTIKDDAQGGINNLIADQKKLEGEMTLTLVEFNTYYNVVHDMVDIQNLNEEYTLTPMGMTALLDSLGKSIIDTGEKLKALKDEDRPETVLFVIVTDGQENSSLEFTTDQIKEMIKTQNDDYNWEFMYLGADVDSFAEATSIGIGYNNTANFTKSNVSYVMDFASTKIASTRSLGEFDSIKDDERDALMENK